MNNLFEHTHPADLKSEEVNPTDCDFVDLFETKVKIGKTKVNVSRASVKELSALIAKDMLSSINKMLALKPSESGK
jgi:hypothetical protein